MCAFENKLPFFQEKKIEPLYTMFIENIQSHEKVSTLLFEFYDFMY